MSTSNRPVIPLTTDAMLFTSELLFLRQVQSKDWCSMMAARESNMTLKRFSNVFIIHKTYQLLMYFTGLWRTIWHRFISKIFWGRVEHIQKQHMQIFGFMKNQSKYLYISNCVFTMNCSTDKKFVFWSFIGQDFIYM